MKLFYPSFEIVFAAEFSLIGIWHHDLELAVHAIRVRKTDIRFLKSNNKVVNGPCSGDTRSGKKRIKSKSVKAHGYL